MNEPIFDHERFDIDRVSIDYVTFETNRVDAHSADPADGMLNGGFGRVRVPRS